MLIYIFLAFSYTESGRDVWHTEISKQHHAQHQTGTIRTSMLDVTGLPCYSHVSYYTIIILFLIITFYDTAQIERGFLPSVTFWTRRGHAVTGAFSPHTAPRLVRDAWPMVK